MPLFWILLHFAVACVPYFFLAYPDGDRELALAGVLAFAMMCTLAAAELFGRLLAMQRSARGLHQRLLEAPPRAAQTRR